MGDGQLIACKDFELPQLKEACRKLPNCNVKITFIVVQKRINTRLFLVSHFTVSTYSYFFSIAISYDVDQWRKPGVRHIRNRSGQIHYQTKYVRFLLGATGAFLWHRQLRALLGVAG